MSFLLVAGLGVKGGGYDLIVRNQVGVIVWLVAICACATFVLPRLSRAAWLTIALLLSLGAWHLVGAAGAESAERAVNEASRVWMYCGILVLGVIAAQSQGARPILGGVACGAFVVVAVAIVHRLLPGSFAQTATAQLLPSTANRLSYPVNYWNGLAALGAMLIPLLVWGATQARYLLLRALNAAALPICALAIFLTFSRGGVLATGVGVVVVLVCSNRRISTTLAMLAPAGGAAILILAAAQRSAIEDGLRSGAAQQQGRELLVYLVITCVAVGLLHAAWSLSDRHVLPRTRSLDPRARIVILGVICAAAVAVMVWQVESGAVQRHWHDFKQPTLGLGGGRDENRINRFESTSGNGRYQYWKAAVAAFDSKPITGIGAGSFESWWARHATIPGFVRDAHSLYFQTLAESGLIGAGILAAFFIMMLGSAARRTRHAEAVVSGPVGPAAILATAATFAVAASFDWIWQIPVLPAVFLLTASITLASAQPRPSRRAGNTERVGLVLVGAVCTSALLIPLATTTNVRRSQAAAQDDHLVAAMKLAERAQAIQPYAASAHLQAGLVSEARGDFVAAATELTEATREEPFDWRARLLLARVDARRGQTARALQDFRRAKKLNPQSSIFQK